ncbi:MAG TPA: hypothetical protein VNT51_11270 [Miltoncostaeaceae bacterium]|nr:hypothetical protein [Miltoncostaeaceae bacterium]
MRRAAPPPRLRVDTAAAPPLCRVAPGPNGLRLEADPAGAPEGRAAAPHLALALAGPVPCEGLDVAHGGRLVLAWSPGVVRSVGTADVGQMFDRRPAGLVEGVGARGANAGLLRADDGWRAVVLPSLGDRLAGLGDGPVAIAPDGLRVAVATADAVEERALADGAVLARHPGGATALEYGADGALLAARGAVVGHADAPAAPSDGPPVRRLRAAADAPVAVSLDEAGAVRVHGREGAAPWEPPFAGVTAATPTADGAWVLLAAPEGVALVRAADGALGVRIRGAVCGAALPDGRLVVGGPWGIAAIVPVSQEKA